MTLVVMVTLPITLSKMKKVDYYSYYMGYNAVKSISANVIPGFFKEEDDGCAFVLGGVCFSAPFPAPAVSKSECEELKTELEIEVCYFENDYWVGALKTCGGRDKMPSREHLSLIASYVYNTNISGEVYDGLELLTDRVQELGFTTSAGAFHVWSGEEKTVHDAYFRSFASDRTYSRYYKHDRDFLQGVCVLDESDESEETDYTTLFCQKLEQTFNKYKSDCSVPVSTVQAAVPGGNFKNLTPHIELANGLKLYIGSDLVTISELSDAEDELDREGFEIYIDVNGESGKSILWEDVFPFYLLKSGKVIAAYNESSPSGGNNMEHLKVNVVYDDYSGPNRALKLLMKDANFRSAACAVGYIKSSKYCDGKVQYDLCKDMTRDCRMMVKEPIKIF